MVTVIKNGKYITHNMSQFKKIISGIVKPELPADNTLDVWEDDNEDINPSHGNSQLNVLPLNHPQPVCNRRYPARMKCPALRYGFKQ